MTTSRLKFISLLLALSGLPTFAHADDKLVPQILNLLGNPDREFRAAALDTIRTSAKGEAQTQLFAAELPKLNADAQAALISALADRGDALAKPAVLEQLGSKDESVRAACLRALGKIGNASDLPALTKALTSGSNAEQRAAHEALVFMRDPKVSKTIAENSQSVPAADRSKMVEVLGARRASSELPTIIAATTNADSGVRAAAMRALGVFGKPEQLVNMLPGVLAASKGGERDSAEKSVAEVCMRIENEDARGTALISALETIDAGQRDELISLVGRVGGKRLIKFVADIATGDDPARRKFGIDALSKWPDAGPADTLLEIANETKDQAERQLAFHAYVKVSASRDRRKDGERLMRMKEAMKEARSDDEKTAVINRTRTAYDVEAMRFVRPYLDEPAFCQIACETIVELAHHRQVRDPAKEEFDEVLAKVISLSKNEEVVDRANRYKRGETWERKK